MTTEWWSIANLEGVWLNASKCQMTVLSLDLEITGFLKKIIMQPVFYLYHTSFDSKWYTVKIESSKAWWKDT